MTPGSQRLKAIAWMMLPIAFLSFFTVSVPLFCSNLFSYIRCAQSATYLRNGGYYGIPKFAFSPLAVWSIIKPSAIPCDRIGRETRQIPPFVQKPKYCGHSFLKYRFWNTQDFLPALRSPRGFVLVNRGYTSGLGWIPPDLDIDLHFPVSLWACRSLVTSLAVPGTQWADEIQSKRTKLSKAPFLHF